MAEENTNENSTAPASLVERLVSWLFPSTVKRLIKLDALRSEAKKIELEYNYSFLANHGKTEIRLIKEHSRLCLDFEKTKYWWMKNIKNINI